MRGKRLTTEEVEALPDGTIIIVVRTGKGWFKINLGESIEKIVGGLSTRKALRDNSYVTSDIFSDKEVAIRGLQAEYYEFLEDQ